MKREDFGYHLPPELIAQAPVHPRDSARLMVIHRDSGEIQHDVFSNIGRHLPPRSVLVLNESKVIPARIFGRRETGGLVEIFLLKKLEDGCSFESLIRPLKRLKLGEKIIVGKDGVLVELVDAQRKVVRFNKKNIERYLGRIGHIPLPPYIRRSDKKEDRRDYQTVYARAPGSVASPTAGLHFTRALLTKLQKQGHSLERVILHVNYATFKPVEEEDVSRHKMHEENYAVASQTWQSLEKARAQGRKIVAVGTTGCRVLETVASGNSLSGMTDIFLYPGRRFRMTDILITNFHLPYSTLLLLVHAFGGQELMTKAYQEAIKEKYRFYSYGDAMMIL